MTAGVTDKLMVDRVADAITGQLGTLSGREYLIRAAQAAIAAMGDTEDERRDAWIKFMHPPLYIHGEISTTAGDWSKPGGIQVISNKDSE